MRTPADRRMKWKTIFAKLKSDANPCIEFHQANHFEMGRKRPARMSNDKWLVDELTLSKRYENGKTTECNGPLGNQWIRPHFDSERIDQNRFLTMRPPSQMPYQTDRLC